MSKISEKLAALQERKLELVEEEKKIIQARKNELASLIEKIPGSLLLDNIILAGIITDGINQLKTNPKVAEKFIASAQGLPSFRKSKNASADKNASPNKENE